MAISIYRVVMETSKHHISFTLPYKKLQGLALFFQRTLPTPSISPELHDLVSRYKGFIDNIEDSKKWDYAKKISNEYELINQGGNRSVSSIYPISRSYFKLLELIRGVFHSISKIHLYGAIR